jgi:hypothetical protein
MSAPTQRRRRDEEMLIMRRRFLGGVSVSAAAALLAYESNGLAIDFTDTFFRQVTGLSGSARVKDTTTPLNNYNGVPTNLLTYSAPSLKLARDMDGDYKYRPHNLWLNSESYQSNTSQFLVNGTVSGNVISVSGTEAYVYRVGAAIAALTGASYAVAVDVTSSVTAVIGLRSLENSSGFASQAVSCVAGVTQRITLTGVSTLAGVISLGIDQRGGVVPGSTANLTGATVTLNRISFRRLPSPDIYVPTTTTSRITLPHEWGATNRFASPLAPATQTISGLTVGKAYTVYCEGAGSIALSGAGTGLATPAQPRTFKAVTTSVTCAVSGALTEVHVRESLGIRVEPAATNLIATQFASWSPRDSGTITANAAAGPTGVVNAAKIADSSTGALQGATLSGVSVTAATTYTLSAFIKADTGVGIANLNILCSGGTPVEYGVVVDLSTGNTTARTGVATPTAIGATLEANGFYRVYVTFSSGTGNTAAVLDLYAAWNTTLTGGLSVAAVGSVLASLPQLETGSVATTPIEAFGSTVTRAVDNLTLAIGKIPWNNNAGTFYAAVRYPSASVSGEACIGFYGGSQSMQHRAAYSPLNTGVARNFFAFLTPTANAVDKRAVAFSPGNSAGSRNGGAATADTTVVSAFSTISGLAFDVSPAGGFPSHGWISEILYVPRRMSNAEIQARTA